MFVTILNLSKKTCKNKKIDVILSKVALKVKNDLYIGNIPNRVLVDLKKELKGMMSKTCCVVFVRTNKDKIFGVEHDFVGSRNIFSKTNLSNDFIML